MIPEIGRAEIADAVTPIKLFRDGRRDDLTEFLLSFDSDEKTALIVSLVGIAVALADRPVDIPINQFLDKLTDLA